MNNITKIITVCCAVGLITSCSKGIKSVKGYSECTSKKDGNVCMAWSNKSCTGVMIRDLSQKMVKDKDIIPPCNLIKDGNAMGKKWPRRSLITNR
jgi:hypothetical protein